MENQKIQQLIRLASIADKNGDYKIADKIFNKLAASPPPLRFRDMPKLLELLEGGLKNLRLLEPLVEEYTNLVKLYDANKAFQDLDNVAMRSAWKKYQEGLNEIPLLESKKKAHLEGRKTDPNPSETQAKLTDYINHENQYFDLFDKRKTEPFTYEVAKKQLEMLEEKLDEIKPKLDELPPNHPDRMLVAKISGYLEKINIERAYKYDRAMKDIIKQREKSRTKTTTRGFKGNTSTTVDTSKEIKEGIDTARLLANAATKGGNFFRRELDKFFSAKSARSGVEQPPFNSLEFLKVFRLLPPKYDVAEALSDKLFDIIKVYDYKFIIKYEEYIKTIKGYDPNNAGQFSKAVSAAAAKMQDSPEVTMINTLIETIEKTLKVEIENAKLVLGQKDASVGTILTQIQKTNPNLSRQIGLDNAGLQRLIALLDRPPNNISIDEFLMLKQKVVPNMTNEWVTPLLYTVGTVKGIQLSYDVVKSLINKRREEGKNSPSKAPSAPSAPRAPSVEDIMNRAREQSKR
jgi:hypothetical protein